MDRAMQTESIVYLIHDDESVKDRTRHLAEKMGVATQSIDSVEELVELYDDSRDSCLITDLQLQNGSGFELLRAIEDQSIFLPSIFITSHADVKAAVEVMRAGAVTLLEIPFHDDDLRDAIDFAIQRDAAERNNNLRRHTIRARMNALTDKERQVMDFVVEGTANKVIAKRLGVSIRTVESRRQAVFQKMQVNSLAELVRRVVESERSGF
jgi:two-component system response regulator FixJ